MDKSVNKNDAVVQFEGFKVAIDRKYDKDSVTVTVDFVKSLWANGFVVNVEGYGRTCG